MNKFVNVLVAAAVAATGAIFAPTAQAAPEQQEVCYDITYVHEKRWSKEVPGEKEVSHQEYKYERQVADYKTQYHFRKYTQTKTRTKIQDSQYKWHWSEWSAYGEWTPWQPETHTSWEDSKEPLGQPAYHGGGGQNDNYYRQWQARWDGQTKEIKVGSHTESSGWVKSKPEGDGWTKVDERTVVDSEAVPGYTIYYVSGGDHTRTLGESNWTTDTPAGWTFVDERDREVKNEIPCVNPPKRITKRFQVDTYSNPTTKLANIAASYDNDGRLKYGEDRPHYGHSRWQIVSVVGYDNWTKAQWITAVNKATTRAGVGNVTSTHHVGKVKKGQKLTVAWEIKKDSWPNKGKRGPQTFFARGLK